MVNSVNNNYFGDFKLPNEVPKVEREQSFEEMKRFYGEPVELDLHQFALLHGDTFLKGDDLEGGKAADAIRFWEELVCKWYDKEGLSPGLTEKELLQAYYDFHDITESERLILAENPEGLQDLIILKIEKRGRFAILLRVKGKKGDCGHVFECVLEKGDDQKIRAHLLNKGGGAELHPILVVTETKDKISYRYPTIIYDDLKILESDYWKDLCQRVILYATESPDDEVEGYQSAELYSIFSRCGRIEEEPHFSEEHAVTAQRSGTCSSQLAKLLLRSATQSDERKNKRLLFCARFQSFVSLVKQDEIDLEDPDAQRIVQQALQGFCVQVEKLKGEFITDKELVLARLLVEDVKLKLDASLAAVPKYPEFRPNLPMHLDFKFHFPEGKTENSEKSLKVSRPVPLVTPLNDPSNFNATLDEWLDFMRDQNVSAPNKVHFTHQALRYLPPPLDPFWDKITDCKETMTQLHELGGRAIESISAWEKDKERRKSYQPMITLIGITTYAYLARLAYRIPKLKLKEWAFALPEYSFDFFTHEWEQKQFNSIKEYFKSIKNNGKLLFAEQHEGLGHLSTFELVVEEVDKGRCGQHKCTNLFNSLSYLKQFFKKYHIDDNKERLVQYLQLWEQHLITNPSLGCLYDFILINNNETGLRNFYQKHKGIHYFPNPNTELTHFKFSPLYNVYSFQYSENQFFITPPDGFDHHEITEKLPFICENLSENILSLSMFPHLKNWEDRSLYQEVEKCGKPYSIAPDLIVSNVISLMRQYPEARSKSHFRQWVMRQLLRQDHIALAVRREPRLIEDLRVELLKTICYFEGSSQNRRIALEWIRLAYFVETRFPEPEIDKLQAACERIFNEAKTEDDDRYIACCLKVIFYSHLNHLSDIQMTTLLQARAESSLLVIDTSKDFFKWEQGATAVVVHHHKAICKRAKENGELYRPALQQISQKLQLPEDHWKGEFPQFSQEKVSVDLLKGETTVEGASRATWRKSFLAVNFEDIHNKYAPFIGPFYVNSKDKIVYGSEGKVIVHIRKVNDISKIEMNKTNLFDPGWYDNHIFWSIHLFPFEGIPGNRTAWDGSHLKPDYKIWFPKKSQRVDFLVERHQVPFAYGHNNQVFRLDPTGNPTGEQLVKLEKKSSHPNIAFLKTFTEKIDEDFVVWSRNGRITSIYWQTHDLELIVKENQLYPSKHPDYVLTNERFENIPTAKVFRNRDGEVLVGIPYDGKRTCKLVPEEFANGPCQKNDFFFYPVCTKTGGLSHQDPLPFFHLFFLYDSLHEYSKAKELLDRWNTFTFYDYSHFSLFKESIEKERRNPSQAALYAHLALHFIETSEMVTKENWNWLVKELYFTIYNDYLGSHIAYLRKVMSSYDCHRIPHDLEVSHEQFKRLEEALKEVPKHIVSKKKVDILPKEPEEWTVNFYLEKQKDGNSAQISWSQVRYYYLQFKWKFESLYRECREAKGEKKWIIQNALMGMLHSGRDCRIIASYLQVVLEHPEEFPEELPGKTIPGQKEWEKAKNLSNRKPAKTLISSIRETPHRTQKGLVDVCVCLKKIPECGQVDHPLGVLGLVTQTEEPQNSSFPLENRNAKTELASKLHQELQNAHGKIEASTLYKVERGELEESISKQIDQDRVYVQQEMESIIIEANWSPDQDEEGMDVDTLIHVTTEQHRLFGRKKNRLTWQQLLQGFMGQSQTALTKHNPFLDEEKVRQIYKKMAAVMIVSSRIDQANEALKAHQRGATDQELGTILDKKRLYEPVEFPLFLVYEYMTGMMLRPNQVELLQWIFAERDQLKRSELLVEFQAGGGKTKVISAILAFDAQRKGKLPVFFSLPALHDMTKNDLADSLISVFRKHVRVMEITLEKDLFETDLEHIRDQLKRWHQEGACLLMVPETWHALNLALRFARKRKDEENEPLCAEIIAFFKEKAFFIVDEAHRNAESLWQANIATGHAKLLPAEEQNLFITCYKFLLQDPKLQLKVNNQAMMTEEELKGVMGRLADHLIEKMKFDGNLKSALLDQKEPFPLTKEQSLLYLARGLLSQILPSALKMVHSYDYGKGLKNEVEGPRYQRKPTTSQYECADLAAALSCQGLFQRGLDRQQMRLIVGSLLNRHLSYPGVHLEPEATPMARKFFEWVGGEGPQLYYLEGLIEDDRVIDDLIQKMGKKEQVIEEYLLEHLLPQIRVFPEKVSSTAVDLVEGCAEGLLFSATMGIAEEYPQREKPGEKDDQLFQAKVISRACEKQNSGLSILKPNTPTLLFEDLFEKGQAFDFEGIIDIGGWTRDYSTQEVAEEFLAFATTKKLEYDGAIFIVENLASVDEEQSMMFLGKGDVSPIQLQGSDLIKALKGAGIGNAEDLKLFKVYGASQCTGTDLKLTPKAKMIVTIGETTRLWSLIQGIMRARQFLRPLSQQTIAWVCPQPLVHQIPHEETLTPPDIFMWALEREAESIESRIIARAFQQIVGVVQSFIEASNGDAIEQFQNHLPAFIAKLGRDLRALYGEQGKKVDTKKVLEKFTLKLLKAAKVENFNRWNQINRVIEETEKLVPEITRPEATPSKGAAQQKVQAKSQTKQKQKHKGVEKKQSRTLGKLSPATQEPYYKQHLDIYSPWLIKEAKPLNSLTSGDFFDQNLRFLPNAVNTSKDPETILKKLSYLLLTTEEDGEVYAIAISQEDAQEYRKQIAMGPIWATKRGRSVTPREVALISTAGVVAQHRISNEHISGIMQSDWWTKILTDLNFLNGRIHQVTFFSKQIATWRKKKNFADFWKWIQEVQGTPEGMHLQAINTFLDPDLKLEELGTINRPKFPQLDPNQLDNADHSDTDDTPDISEMGRPPSLPAKPNVNNINSSSISPIALKKKIGQLTHIVLPTPLPPKKPLNQSSSPITTSKPSDQSKQLKPIPKPPPPTLPEPQSTGLTLTKVCTIAAAIFATLSLSFAVYMGAIPLLTAIPIACALAILPLAYLYFSRSKQQPVKATNG